MGKRKHSEDGSGWKRERPDALLDLGDVACCMGIDEAGRGPVLGPMVYGAAFAPLDKDDDLRKLGFADSKTLSEEKRSKLFGVIKKTDFLGWMTVSLSAAELSNKMLQRNKYNLNAISHDTAIEMIQRALSAGVNVTAAYIDTVGDQDSYQRKLSARFPSIDFTVCKKADSIYPITSAASICAKVTRDHEIKNWTFSEEGFTSKTQIGSGYPADEGTQTWLASNGDSVFGYPDLVRFSWRTIDTLFLQNAHPFKWEAEEEDDESQGKLQFQAVHSASATQQGTVPLKTLPLPKACSFFAHRSLHTVSCLPH